MPNKLFDGQEADQPLSPELAEALATKLSSIQNADGKQKYDSVEKALDALNESQNYIPTLKTELDAANAKLAEAQAKIAATGEVEAIVKSLLPDQEQPKPADTKPETKGLDEQGVADIVAQKLAEQSKQSQATANENKVVNFMTEKFGEKAKEELAKKAVELNSTPEQLGQLAITSPDMVISLFTQGAQIDTPTPSYSPINTSGFQQAPDVGLQPPEKSLLSGATMAEQTAYMQKVKEHVYKKYDVQV